MRSRRNYQQSENRSVISSSHTSTNEDRARLRNMLRGGIAGSQVARPDEKEKKALMKRGLARSKTMDKTPPPPSKPVAHVISASISPSSVPISDETERETTQKVKEEIPAVTTTTSLGTRRVDRVGANPTAVDFRNRLRNVASQRPPGRSGPTPESTSTSFLDEKTREMIQQRFRKRHIVPPSLHSHKATATFNEEKVPDEDDVFGDNDPDLEGYDSFFEILKCEVHGQHSLVCVECDFVLS